MGITQDDLRRLAVVQTLFPPTTLKTRPARAGLCAGRSDPRPGARSGPDPASSRQELSRRRPEQRYAKLGIEEDFFVIYGFVTRAYRR